MALLFVRRSPPAILLQEARREKWKERQEEATSRNYLVQGGGGGKKISLLHFTSRRMQPLQTAAAKSTTTRRDGRCTALCRAVRTTIDQAARVACRAALGRRTFDKVWVHVFQCFRNTIEKRFLGVYERRIHYPLLQLASRCGAIGTLRHGRSRSGGDDFSESMFICPKSSALTMQSNVLVAWRWSSNECYAVLDLSLPVEARRDLSVESIQQLGQSLGTARRGAAEFVIAPNPAD